ncbi:MAG: hypothetical protein AB7J13_02030 [Pyrinomonadaceae bacterium]
MVFPIHLPGGVTVDRRDKYLYACISPSKIDQKAAFDLLSEIIDCGAPRYKNILIEREWAGDDDQPLFGAIEMAAKLSPDMRFAVVNSHLPDGRRTRPAGQNWQAASYSRFPDLSAAEQWLVKDG